MNKVRIQHKDGDKTGVTMIYMFYIQLKKHKELWENDKDNYVLNRYYKGLLTKTLKTTELLINKYEKDINYVVGKEVEKVLETEFSNFKYNLTDVNLELVKTMFFAMLLIDTAITHKKKMLGVILKSMITDITKVFNEYVKMWIRDIDDNVLKIKG
jgi:dynein heavy chain 2